MKANLFALFRLTRGKEKTFSRVSREAYMKETIASRVEALAAPVAREMGYQLFDVEFVKEGPDYYLRLFITAEEGITVEDCEKMSRAVDPLLDEADLIRDHYCLEVSSVGLDRPLKKEKDFLYFMDQPVEGWLFRPDENGDYFTGVLCAYEQGTFTVRKKDGAEKRYAVKDARLIRPYIDFSEYDDKTQGGKEKNEKR